MENALQLSLESVPTKEISAADFVAAHMPPVPTKKPVKVPTPQVPALPGMTPLGLPMKAPYVAPKTLEEFVNRVDKLVVRALGLSVHDLPDYCYADDFEDGERPAETAKRVIRSAMAGGLD